MNAQRRQACLTLIEALLSCPSGEEIALLQENRALLDSDLLQLVEQIAAQAQAEGRQELADLLQELYYFIQTQVDAPPADGEERQRTYLNLIEQLLRCLSGEEGQILTANAQLIDSGFLQACEAVAEIYAQQGEENGARFLRQLAAQLGAGRGETNQTPQAYLSFLQALLLAELEGRGNPQPVYAILRDNLDKLDEGFRRVLRDWASAALNDDDAETREGIAALLENLCIHIIEFPLGRRSQNIEIAIAGYEFVLHSRENNREKWAQTQNNLGNAYSDRILGERADNLEKAIACYRAALEFRTRTAYPEYWAMTQNNLGTAYRNKILWERAENIENALACYRAALEVYTRTAYPEYWATTQNNLAVAYSDRILGERAENIENALACYRAALEVRTRTAYPEYWATTQHNLGGAYSSRIFGERADNLENAIACYRAALEVRTRESFPQNHADTLFNLGLACRDARRLSDARDAFAAAIDTVEFLRGEIASGDAAKQKLAEEWNTLYQRMVEVCLELGRDAEALEYVDSSKSRILVELFANADIFPKGASEQQKQQLKELRNRLNAARQFLEQAGAGFADTPSPPQTFFQENLLSSDGSESRNFFRPSAPAPFTREDVEQQRQIFTESRQQLDALLNQIQQIDPDFTNLPKRVKPIGFGEIRELINADTAILEWYITPSGFQTFIITRDTLHVEQFTAEELQQLESWKDEYLGDYRQVEWEDALAERLARLSQILRLDAIIARLPKTCRQLILIPYRYLHLLPLHALPLQATPLDSGAGAQIPEICLLDRFPAGIRYAPSCQLLQLVQKRQRPDAEARPLFAIHNPTRDLPYTDIEVETIQRAFAPDTHILPKQDATKSALEEKLDILRLAHYIHFACHGTFNFTAPLLSGLVLADSLEQPEKPENQEKPEKRYITLRNGRKAIPERCLTLQYIFEKFDLPHCRLVTLSACESGLTDSTKSTDEYIGLASGFLYAGSTVVLNTLWCVDDFATAFLMIKFYQTLCSDFRVPVSQVLKEAVSWLRSVSRAEFLEWASALGLSENQVKDIKTWLRLYDKKRPFASPQYWAAFCAIGQ